MTDPNAQPPQQPAYQAPAYQYQAPAYQQQPVGPLPAPGPGEPFDGAASPEDLSRPLYGATLGQAVKRFFGNYANFSGRASRSEFWWVQLFVFLLELIPALLGVVGAAMMAAAAASHTNLDADGNLVTSPGIETAVGGGAAMMLIGFGLLAIIGLALLIPSLAIAWRRLHDANLAGPFWFLSVTSIGSIIVLVFTILPPKPEGRRFVSNK